MFLFLIWGLFSFFWKKRNIGGKVIHFKANVLLGGDVIRGSVVKSLLNQLWVEWCSDTWFRSTILAEECPDNKRFCQIWPLLKAFFVFQKIQNIVPKKRNMFQKKRNMFQKKGIWDSRKNTMLTLFDPSSQTGYPRSGGGPGTPTHQNCWKTSYKCLLLPGTDCERSC